MRLKFIFLLIFSFIINHAQKLKTSDVLKASDSILLQKTNPELFNFFTLSVGSYYKYSKKNTVKIGKFLSKKRLKNEVLEIWVAYNFNYPNIIGVRGGNWVKLDSKLNLIEPISLEFIPNFLWKKQNSNFISTELALKIAIENFKKNGIKIEKPELFYDYKIKLYVYMITNKLNEYKNAADKPSGNTEVIKINAENGKIVETFDGYYGLIIR
ncbi:hypothetical protein [Epilithonimonas sp.]|uniref:hypothetical protein n=1 Tax=Epilithonimonas sp. TaxID=2894511 RepID=UPI0028A703F5|nr:hypothetical protein [Epilithonimonas sp.]